MTSTIEYVTCCGCGVDVDPADAVAKDDDDMAPWLCEGCAERPATCCMCSAPVAWDDAVSRDDDDAAPWLCECCARIVTCCECGGDVFYGEAVALYDDGREPWLCEDCVRVCAECGHTIGRSDAVAKAGDGRAPWLCEGCADDGCLHPYSYHPEPVFFGFGDEDLGPATPFLGLELELEANSRQDRHDIVEATEWGDDVDDFDDLFYCKADGSLGVLGVEVVAHPMTIGYAQDFDWESLCETLAKHGKSWDTGSCGLHVHLSRDSMGRPHLWRFARLINDNPEPFGKLAGRSGSTWAKFAESFGPISKAIAGKADDPDRYSALNLQNDSTVEVRIFRGTLNPVGVLAALELVHAMWAYTAHLSVGAVQNGALGFDAFRTWVESEAADDYPALVERMADRLDQRTPALVTAA